jgi:Ring finger domain
MTVSVVLASIEAECPICLESIDLHNRLAVRTLCRHRFHVECLATWVDRTPTCPLCRRTLEATTPLHLASVASIDPGLRCLMLNARAHGILALVIAVTFWRSPAVCVTCAYVCDDSSVAGSCTIYLNAFYNTNGHLLSVMTRETARGLPCKTYYELFHRRPKVAAIVFAVTLLRLWLSLSIHLTSAWRSRLCRLSLPLALSRLNEKVFDLLTIAQDRTRSLRREYDGYESRVRYYTEYQLSSLREVIGMWSYVVLGETREDLAARFQYVAENAWVTTCLLGSKVCVRLVDALPLNDILLKAVAAILQLTQAGLISILLVNHCKSLKTVLAILPVVAVVVTYCLTASVCCVVIGSDIDNVRSLQSLPRAS